MIQILLVPAQSYDTAGEVIWLRLLFPIQPHDADDAQGGNQRSFGEANLGAGVVGPEDSMRSMADMLTSGVVNVELEIGLYARC